VNLFKIHTGIRQVGLGYGMPVWYIDCGPGLNLTPEDVAKKLIGVGVQKGQWVVVRDGLREKGIGVLAQGLKYLGLRLEVEAKGSEVAPGWFTAVDRWVVWWTPKGVFNLGGLRPRQDIILYQEGDSLGPFLETTKGTLGERGIVGIDIDTKFALTHNLRVYRSDNSL